MACHNPSYVTKGFKMVNDVKPGGVFMINCQWDFDELCHHLNAEAKQYIAKNNIQLYTVNAIDLAIKIGMGKRTNTILQAAFFALAKVMPAEDAIKYMKDAALHSYEKKGMDVVNMNYAAMTRAALRSSRSMFRLPGRMRRMRTTAQLLRASPSWSRWSRTSWSRSPR